jgi:hypothetical protein
VKILGFVDAGLVLKDLLTPALMKVPSEDLQDLVAVEARL